MAKLIMPKNSALIEEIEAVLKIYYEAGDWLSNDEYKSKLKAIIGDDQYPSSYTKKAQIPSYFGFTEWYDITSTRAERRITASGKRMYEAIKKKNTAAMLNEIVYSLEHTTF